MAVSRGPNAGHFYSNLVSPVKVDLQFAVDASDSGGYGIKSLKSNGYVNAVYMNTSATPASADLNPAAGYCWVHLNSNFNKFIGADLLVEPPVTGSSIDISDSSVLTEGVAYEVVTVGDTPAATFTVLSVADSSGSLAGKYFTASDGFGNNYAFYLVVSGSGTPPALTGALNGYTAVPVAISTNAADTAVAAAVETAVEGVNSGNSFSGSTTSATTTFTSLVTGKTLTPPPLAQTSGFTVSAVTWVSAQEDWESIGWPAGVPVAAGGAFIATATGDAEGDGTVKALADSQIVSVQALGDNSKTSATSNQSQYDGAWVLLKFMAATAAGTTTLIPAAPATDAVIHLSLFFDQSSVTVDGL